MERLLVTVPLFIEIRSVTLDQPGIKFSAAHRKLIEESDQPLKHYIGLLLTPGAQVGEEMPAGDAVMSRHFLSTPAHVDLSEEEIRAIFTQMIHRAVQTSLATAKPAELPS